MGRSFMSFLAGTLMLSCCTLAAWGEEKSASTTKADPARGGVFVYGWDRDALFFDDIGGVCYHATTVPLTNESLLQGSILNGPGGTGEAAWVHYIDAKPEVQVGCLAEGWELADPLTIVYHIRKGVHFHNKPPTNGREMTAEDVAFSLTRLYKTAPSYHHGSYNWDTHIESIEATDRYTVVIKAKPGMTGRAFRSSHSFTHIVPRDAVEKYGDLRDWKNACGTGAFILTDYVTGSSATFVKNPDYWMKDPRHPANHLPYLDGVKYLIIPDLSTRLAALRTGKVDSLASLSGALVWDDADQLKKSNPELQWSKAVTGTAAALFWRVDRPELPWHDKKVRHALFMAIDNQKIADFYYHEAEVFAWPILPIPEHMDMFVPLEELPPSIREQYEYHPEKAKQLLAEVGFPDGFKAEVICAQSHVDLLSIVKDYWSKIGVDLKIDVREDGIHNSIVVKKTHKEMIMSGVNPTICFTFSRLQKDQGYALSRADDPVIEAAYKTIAAPETFFDETKKRKVMKDVVPHILEQAYILALPAPYLYIPWQPWVKGYHGETMIGSLSSLGDFVKYVWLDTGLMEKKVGRR